jgi:hypothetical protein
MNAPFAWTRPARRLIASQFLRLRESVGQLARGLRDRIASAAGEAIAVLIRVLLDRPEGPFPSAPPRRSPGGEPSWNEDLDRDPEWDEPVNPFEYEAPPPAPPAQCPAPAPARWRQALTVGVETILWWLRRQPGRFPGLTALVITLGTGAAAYAGAPLVAALVALAGSAMSLVTLADQVAADAAKLAKAVNP